MYLRRSVLTGLGTTLAFGATTRNAIGQQRHDVTIGTTSSSSSLYAYYAALAKLAADTRSSVRITVAETGGTEENISRLSRGQIDAALVVQSSVVDAFRGEGPLWSGKPQKQMRLLSLYYVAPQAFVVRKDSNVTSMEQLNGKPWSAGHRGSGSENVTLQILQALGVKPNLFRGALDDIVRATKNGEIIGFSKGLPGHRLDATMLDLQTSHPFQMIGFTPTEQAVLREKMPDLPLIRIDGAIAQTAQPIMSWAFLVGTVVDDKMPEAAAYDLTRLAVEQRDELAKSFQAAGDDDPVQLTMEHGGIPLHSGAVRFYRERGQQVPPRLMP